MHERATSTHDVHRLPATSEAVGHLPAGIKVTVEKGDAIDEQYVSLVEQLLKEIRECTPQEWLLSERENFFTVRTFPLHSKECSPQLRRISSLPNWCAFGLTQTIQANQVQLTLWIPRTLTVVDEDTSVVLCGHASSESLTAFSQSQSLIRDLYQYGSPEEALKNYAWNKLTHWADTAPQVEEITTKHALKGVLAHEWIHAMKQGSRLQLRVNRYDAAVKALKENSLIAKRITLLRRVSKAIQFIALGALCGGIILGSPFNAITSNSVITLSTVLLAVNFCWNTYLRRQNDAYIIQAHEKAHLHPSNLFYSPYETMSAPESLHIRADEWEADQEIYRLCSAKEIYGYELFLYRSLLNQLLPQASSPDDPLYPITGIEEFTEDCRARKLDRLKKLQDPTVYPHIPPLERCTYHRERRVGMLRQNQANY